MDASDGRNSPLMMTTKTPSPTRIMVRRLQNEKTRVYIHRTLNSNELPAQSYLRNQQYEPYRIAKKISRDKLSLSYERASEIQRTFE